MDVATQRLAAGPESDMGLPVARLPGCLDPWLICAFG